MVAGAGVIRSLGSCIIGRLARLKGIVGGLAFWSLALLLPLGSPGVQSFGNGTACPKR